MRKQLKKYQLRYLFLVMGLVAGITLFLGAWPDRILQRTISVGIAVFYIIWGILSHLKDDQINQKIVLEYLGVGTLAGLLLVLITF